MAYMSKWILMDFGISKQSGRDLSHHVIKYTLYMNKTYDLVLSKTIFGVTLFENKQSLKAYDLNTFGWYYIF